MFVILNNVIEYTVHDITVRQYQPTALGRKLGYKTKTVVVKTGELYGAWSVSGYELTAGNEIVASAMFITHRFVLTDDGNVVDYVSLSDFGVYGAPMLLEFNPVKELDEVATA
jgi:hypothetical protein